MARRLLLPCALILSSAALAGAASTATATEPQWLAPATLDTGTDTSTSDARPKIAANSRGDIAAVWTKGGAVFAAVRRSGADTWLKEPLSDGSAGAQDVRVTADGSDTFVATWHSNEGSDHLASRALEAADENWSHDEVAFSGSETPAYSTVKALADGSIAAAWIGSDAGNHIYVAERSTDGVWTRPDEFVSGSDDASPSSLFGVDIAASSNGRLIVGYLRSSSGTAEARVAEETSPGTWAAPVTVDGNDGSPRPLAAIVAVATGPDGSAAMSWTSADSFSDPYHAVVAYRRANGTWDAAHDVGGSNTRGGPIAIDSDGNLHVAAMDQNDGFHTVTSVRRAGVGTWSALSPLNGIAPLSGPSTITSDRDGSLLLLFKAGTGPSDLTAGLARWNADTGSWTPLEPPIDAVSSLYADAAFAIDGEGNYAFAIQAGDGAIMAAVGDHAPPEIGTITTPEAAETGKDGIFTVSANDRWSALAAPLWDFGDGKTGSGDSVTHAYQSAGTYTVTVTARDVNGFSRSAVRTLTVTDPPRPPAADDGDDEPELEAPLIEARLSGRTVAVNAKVQLKNGRKCKGRVRITTPLAVKTYKATLKTVNGECRAQVTIRLKKTPSTRTRLRVKLSGDQITSRTITTRR